MNIKAMIFDMDGVIMDSMHMWRHLASDYLRSQGCTPDPNINRQLQAMSIGEGAKTIKEGYGIDKSPETIADEIVNSITDFYLYEVGLREGSKEGLKALKEAGIKMCVATSTNAHLAEAALERCGVMGHFEFLLSTADVGGGKDRPDIFLECARRMREAPEDTMIIEDSPVAIRTARDADFKTCAVLEENQKELFDELFRDADVCITYLTELVKVPTQFE